MIVLTFTKLDEVSVVIQTYIGIILSELATSTEFGSRIVAHVVLLEVILREEVDVRIAEWICLGGIVVDILLSKRGSGDSVIGKSFVVKSSVFG